MTSEMTRKLSLLASQDPFFLSWYFARYSEMMSADIVDVASEIGCLPEVMNTMSLCRAPRTEPPNFQQDVEAIANRFSDTSRKAGEPSPAGSDCIRQGYAACGEGQ